MARQAARPAGPCPGPGGDGRRRRAVVLAAGYAACYGVLEAAGRLTLAAPGSRWQVPQTMVAGVPGWRRIAVWGSILGPGFLTRNPYAGFGLLPIVVAAAGGVRG